MQKVNVRKVILNAVKTTEPTWRQYGIKWEDIDYIFIQRGYEQGGFNTSKFSELLIKEKIFSINKIGSILDNFKFNRTYNREFAGNYESPFYLDLEKGKAGEEGIGFYNSVRNFREDKGRQYYKELWFMLVCCNDLKHKYDASFSNYLLVKYSKFKNRSIDENEFLTQSRNEWEQFKGTKPWNDLLGIGENVFDFLMGDIIDSEGNDIEFAKDSYKLDSANIKFLKVTGICNEPEQHKVLQYLKSLELPYTIRQINKGIYSYCSETAFIEVKRNIYKGKIENHGFCHPNRCKDCNVEDICGKDFASLR